MQFASKAAVNQEDYIIKVVSRERELSSFYYILLQPSPRTAAKHLPGSSYLRKPPSLPPRQHKRVTPRTSTREQKEEEGKKGKVTRAAARVSRTCARVHTHRRSRALAAHIFLEQRCSGSGYF